MSPAKTAELIEMRFGLCKNGRTNLDATWVVDSGGSRMGVQITPCEGSIFDMPGHAQRHSAVNCAKMTEPIEMLFGLRTWMSPRKDVLHGGTLAQPDEYD